MNHLFHKNTIILKSTMRTNVYYFQEERNVLFRLYLDS